jgi:hypothetical protein
LPPAISLREHLCFQICAARDRFWHAVVREPERPPSGDGRIARTITAAFLIDWQLNTPVPS